MLEYIFIDLKLKKQLFLKKLLSTMCGMNYLNSKWLLSNQNQ